MAPVTPPPVAEGDDARVDAGRVSKALGEANARLVESRGWYEKQREAKP